MTKCNCTPELDEAYRFGVKHEATRPRYHPPVEAVVTGAPPVTLLACRLCGVLLWDIAAHYGYTHGGDYGGL